MIVYGRNPVREAIRGPRPVHRAWATKNAAREPWLAGAAVQVDTVAADEIERRCGSNEHQGICAETGPYRYAEPEAVLAAQRPLIVGARPGPGSAEPGCDLPQRRVRRGHRGGDPRAPLG